MGVSISWLALRGPASADLLARLSTGLKSKALKVAELPSGWRVLQVDKCDHPLVKEESLRRLSSECDVVAVSVEEHVMFSIAQRWEQGRKIWSVAHQGDSDERRKLDEEGELPDEYVGIKRRCFDLQDKQGDDGSSVDYVFEVPLELANAIVGYRHDAYVLTDEPLPRPMQPEFSGRKRRPAQGVVGLFGIAAACGVAFLVVWLALHSAGMRRGVSPNMDSYSNGIQLLIALPSFFGAIPVGLLLMNLIVYAIPPFRRAFDRWAEIDRTPGFSEASLQLWRVVRSFSLVCFAITFGAAIFG